VKKIGVFVSISLALLVLAAPVLAITWGAPDNGDHPNVGAIVLENWGGSQWVQYCSGTLVHPRILLTAAHCTGSIQARLDAGSADAVWVTFEEDSTSGAGLLAVSQIISHPNWTGQYGASNTYDVGILVLEAPVNGITPATLAYEGYLDDLNTAGVLKHGQDRAKFTIVGYGGSLEWPPPAMVYGNSRQQTQSEFQTLLGSWLRMSQNPAVGNGGSCYGDSGGPAFYVDNGQEILVGITSWGDIPCIATGFNYRVDTPTTLGFIDDVVDALN